MLRQGSPRPAQAVKPGALRRGLAFWPVLLVALIFGLVDGFKAAELQAWIPSLLLSLPGASMGLGWLLPVLVACALAAAWDRVRPCPPAHAAH